MRTRARALDFHVAPEQRVGDAVDTLDAAAFEHERILDLGVDELAVGGDRRVRPHVGVDELGTGTDDGRAAHDRPDQLYAFFDDDPALDARLLVDVTVDAVIDGVEHEPVAMQERVLLAGVDPPAPQDLVPYLVAVVDQP